MSDDRAGGRPAPTRDQVEVVVNGQPVLVAAGSIRSVIQDAIHVAGQLGRPVEQWVLRTPEGDVIPHDLPGGVEYALTGGQRFFLHLGLPPAPTREERFLANELERLWDEIPFPRKAQLMDEARGIDAALNTVTALTDLRGRCAQLERENERLKRGTRVDPLKAGADGQDPPQSDERASPSLPRGSSAPLVGPETPREALAALAHEQWAGWMRHLFGKCAWNDDRGMLIPREWAERWHRQVETPYADLREDEKESDRKEADRVLAVLAARIVGPETPTPEDPVAVAFAEHRFVKELRDYLDTLQITGENIGDIRRSLFVPWISKWNGLVRELTAEREGPGVDKPAERVVGPAAPPEGKARSYADTTGTYADNLKYCVPERQVMPSEAKHRESLRCESTTPSSDSRSAEAGVTHPADNTSDLRAEVGPAALRPEGKVEISGGAFAGLTDAMGGSSGAIQIELGDHEIFDMMASGQAYSLDGKYNFKDRSQYLRPLADLRAEVDRLTRELDREHMDFLNAETRMTEAEAALRSVDAVMDRRDALSDLPNRVDKIILLIKLASSCDPRGDLAKAESRLRAQEAEIARVREERARAVHRVMRMLVDRGIWFTNVRGPIGQLAYDDLCAALEAALTAGS